MAMTQAPADPMTAEGFAHLGEGRRELVRGECIEMSPTGGRHGRLTARLTTFLSRHVEDHGLGAVYGAETGFLIERDPDTVRAPDVAFVAADRVVETDEFLPLAPDLAVEVLSPHDRYGDVDEKLHQWLAAGARHVWVVDPAAERVQVFRRDDHPLDLGPGETLDGSPVLPGFTLVIDELFAPASRGGQGSGASEL
jgi:Uma2 family endonuclease